VILLKAGVIVARKLSLKYMLYLKIGSYPKSHKKKILFISKTAKKNYPEDKKS